MDLLQISRLCFYQTECSTILGRARSRANCNCPIFAARWTYRHATGPAQATSPFRRGQASADLYPAGPTGQDVPPWVTPRSPRALDFLSRVLVTVLHGPTARVRAA